MEPVLALTERLAGVRSLPGREKKIASILAKELTHAGAKVDLIQVDGGGPSLLARSSSRKAGVPTVLLYGHLDTPLEKPTGPGSAAAPSGNPISGAASSPVAEAPGTALDPAPTEAGHLVGPGVADMKAGLAIGVSLMGWASGKDRAVNLAIAYASDESGESRGIHALMKRGIDADICLALEPTAERVLLGGRGRYLAEIRLQGIPAPLARPHLGLNPVDEAAQVVGALARIRLRASEEYGRGSLSVVKVGTKTGRGATPHTCTVTVDRHVVPGETPEQVIDDLRKAVQSLDLRSQVEVRWADRPTPYPPCYTTQKQPLVRLFLQTVRQRAGGEASVAFGETAGDYNHLGVRMPTVVFGPAGGSYHTPGEWVDPESVLRVQQIYIEYLDAIKQYARHLQSTTSP